MVLEPNRQSVYLDYAASAPLHPKVREAMDPWLDPVHAGNPSAVHRAGRQARTALEDARDRIADALGIHPLDVLFTSGATEANNLAIAGALQGDAQAHVIAGATDHPSVIEPLTYAQTQGRCTLTWCTPMPVGNPDCGVIPAEHVTAALTPQTRLVVGTLVTSELGAIQPISNWLNAMSVHDEQANHPIWSHIDATQGIGRVPLEDIAARCTSMAISAHKLGGPQGVGVCIVRRNKTIISPILGGGQERGIRSGTIPVALCVGAGEAIAHAVNNQQREQQRIQVLSDSLVDGLTGTSWTPTVRSPHRVANIVHLTAPDTDTETAVMALDRAGVYVSAGTACQSGALKTSPLIKAIGLAPTQATLRLSMGWASTTQDIAQAVSALTKMAAGTAATGNMGSCVF
ncbi:cysteine desulfurase family protein [Stomatohabitans albus]|uniref:cysteine desulfurase family protein n=1 Tax=Stomatohabitans albus TaxID=3110766 RepID=UPI00300D9E81